MNKEAPVKMQKYAVIGNPISHSLSPIIHHQFAKQCAIDLTYEKILVDPGNFAQQFTLLSKNYAGLNVTLPFKEQVLPFCHRLTEYAKAASAVNTVQFLADGTILGDNTDGRGLLQDLHNKQVALQDSTLLIIGAGGSVRGLIPAIQTQKPKSIMIANRTLQRAQQLADEFCISSCELNKIPNQHYDLIIYAIALKHDLPLPMLKATTYYDINYLTTATQLPVTHYGLGMLVEQAALSFERWTGIKPDTSSVLAHIQQAQAV